jgi:lysozyme
MSSGIFRFAFAAALVALLAGCGTGGGEGGPLGLDVGMPSPGDFPVQGIDVSKYQGVIDWNAVAGTGVKFVWIKATEGGDHLDEHFVDNWQAAKAAGLAVGAYHFVYWCRPPLDEVRWFEENAPVEPGTLPPVLDVEATPESKTCKRHLDAESAQADMRVMLEDLTRFYGRKPVIYTSVDFYEAILSDGAFSDYPLWVRSTKHYPSVRYGSRKWMFWQYQADGRISGIDGKVDRNAFHGTTDEWADFLKGKTSTN